MNATAPLCALLQRSLSGDQWFGRMFEFVLTRLNAIASRDSDEKDVDSARTAGGRPARPPSQNASSSLLQLYFIGSRKHRLKSQESMPTTSSAMRLTVFDRVLAYLLEEQHDHQEQGGANAREGHETSFQTRLSGLNSFPIRPRFLRN
ncbi:hypothetical protein [Pseudomonas syringae]|uniref:hypothetical protein n=1 Tax=Pseudomonas syringae TaxID=317 RepID=UPI0002A79295|nr:hypothetical protein [Pseudomonas syringae]ELP98222.1 hypothetical protein A979_17848 [Pseudomonas syringae BRIP34876]ELQ05347.1 hypothetical protein A987_06672 [Pseudomonas syringae BRIP34881]